MFFGREKELGILQKAYDSDKFEYVVIYGRRRVGKTSLLNEFVKKNPGIFLSCVEQNDELNRKMFTDAVCSYFGYPSSLKFSDWSSAFDFFDSLMEKENSGRKFLLILDEYPYAAKANPSLSSILQNRIDQVWQENKRLKLILCGSSLSFMHDEVLSEKAPLYARQTKQFEVLPFDYSITEDFFPHMSDEERIATYGILGGVPLYLSQFKDGLSLKENIQEALLEDGSVLFEEPINLLKAEFKEPYFYNSLLSAIASGASTLNEIATKVQEDASKVGKYLESLRKVHIVERILPYGEKEKSRKGIYTICDNYFAFWFRYIFGHEGQIQFMGPQAYANKILETLDIFLSHVFEKTCEQYIQKLAQKGKLPFVPNGIGRWWGNNPIKKKQDAVDILGRDGKRGLFVECKFRNEPFDLKEFQDLLDASNIFTDIQEKYYLVIIKSSYTDAVKKEASHYSARLLTIEDMFHI